MKKIIFMFLLLSCFPLITKAIVTNSSYANIKVYYFYEKDCSKCKEGKNFLESEKKNNKKIDVEYINLNTKSNKELYNKVKKELNIKKDKEPLTIIGSNYIIGFNNKIKTKIKDLQKLYEDETDYCDLVYKIKNNEDTLDCKKTNNNISNISNKMDIYLKIILLIVSAIVALVSIILLKKNKA